MILKQGLVIFFYCFNIGWKPHWIKEIRETPAEYVASRDTKDAWETAGGKGVEF
ncbi:hypothetical protein ACDZ29_24390 [Peribacillus sp. RS7]